MYLRFFEQRVQSFSMGDCGDSKGAIACVIQAKDPTKIWLTELYLTHRAEPIERIAILLHEARHTEDGMHHVACPDSFDDGGGHGILSIVGSRAFAGDMACDDKPLGSYGVETIFLRNIERACVSCSRRVRDTAGTGALDSYIRIIDPSARKTLYTDLFQ